MANYLNIIGEYFPAADAYITGSDDPTVYGDIQWVTTPIAQGTLDAYDGEEGVTLDSGIVVNEQSFANRQTPIYDATSGQWKNETFGKLFRFNADAQTFGSTFATVFFDTNTRTDTTKYTYSGLPNGTVTLLEAGWYEVTYDITANSTGTSRQVSEHKITINGSDVLGSSANTYHRTAVAGKGTASGFALINVATNDVLRIQCKSVSGSNLTTVANACRIRIEAVG